MKNEELTDPVGAPLDGARGRPQGTALHLLNWLPAGALLLVLLALLLGGCASWPESIEIPVRPAAAEPHTMPVNYTGVASLPPEIRRVVLLPVSGNGVVTPETAAALDPVFAAALQRQMRFEVVSVSRDWCRRYFGAEEFSSAAALPHDFLTRLAQDHAADAVLFVDVTAYCDHRPLALGVRAKLARVAGPWLVWSIDEILSTDDPAVAAAAQLYARNNAPAGLPVDVSASALQSPSRFAAYVAASVFGTLPPR
jgi:hypothetical protein